MPVLFHENTREFHLFNDTISYVIQILPNGHLGQLYYGKRLHDRESFAHMMPATCRPMVAWPMPERPLFSLEMIRQEYPCFGSTDFRQPAFEILQENGSHISDFRYVGHQIRGGKPELEGLPQSYTEKDEEADTLEIRLADSLTGAELTLSYTIFAGFSAMARSARFRNGGVQTLRLNRTLSVSVDFPDHDFLWMQFSGAWGRERAPRTRTLESGITAVESARGHSSANENPFVILRRPGTTEDDGEAYGFSFVYSGNFLAQAEVDSYNMLRFTMGINPREFSWKLSPGEEFQTPEVLMSYSRTGLNGLSQTLHKLLRTRVARGTWRDRPRPVLLNNWEATGMEFTEESVLKIAAKGAEVGVELFVLDDGWFGRRTEFSGLGDWFVDTSKLPGGVAGLAEKVNALGMDFGIWIEPEMVSEDSDLYREHPEFVLRTPGRSLSLGRNQLVLDFSNPQVVDYIYDMLVRAFDGADIAYIKWDMNRSITECYSPHWSADRQGEVYHRYMLGVYRLYEKLIARYPRILFESCASGGSRFDAGMLYYAPQAWCSDDTDAVERVRIQYGSSYGYPVSSMGAHVSECPNLQSGRSVPLATRANAAFFGAFGYEMDLNALSEEEIGEVRRQVAFVKEHRALLQFGTFYRLSDPYKEDSGAWMVVDEGRTEAIVGLYQGMSRVNDGFTRLRLRGLDPERQYRINGGATAHWGDELMEFGLMPHNASHYPMTALYPPDCGMEIGGDFDSCLFHLTAC